MGLRRYLTPSNWYSDQVEILLKRTPGELEMVTLKENHSVLVVTEENVADTQRFENSNYTQIYRNMLAHGDIGYFGYIDGKCSCRLWGKVRPTETKYYGVDLGLDEEGIYVQYVETALDARRHGICRECLSYLVQRCHKKTMYAMVDMDNQASMVLHKSLGFCEEAVLHVRRRYMKEMTTVHWVSKVSTQK